MSNDFYNASGNPSARSNLSSQNMRVEFSSVATAFNKLPGLTGNGGRTVKVKNDATAMEASSVLFDDGSSVMVGASATRSIGGVTQRFYVESTDAAGRQGAGNVHNSTTAGGEGASLALGRSRGSALSAVTAVAVNDGLGQIKVFGADGTSLTKAAAIEVYADGTVSTSVVPGRISFKAADTSGVLTETARATGTEFRFSKAKALDGTSAIQFYVEPTLTNGDPIYKSLKDDIASTATGKGTALVGSEDAGNYYTGTTNESQLQQLGRQQWYEDFWSHFSTAQKADILAYTYTLDCRAALQEALDTAFAAGRNVLQPAGGYRVDTSLVLPGSSATRGKPFVWRGMGTGEPFVISNTGGTIIKAGTSSDIPVLKYVQDVAVTGNGQGDVSFIRFVGNSATAYVVQLASFYGLSEFHHNVIHQLGDGGGFECTWGATAEVHHCYAINADFATSGLGAARTGIGFYWHNDHDAGLVTFRKCTSRGWLTCYKLGDGTTANLYQGTIQDCECSVYFNGVEMTSKAMYCNVINNYFEGGDAGTSIIDTGNFNKIRGNNIFAGFAIGVDLQASGYGGVCNDNIISMTTRPNTTAINCVLSSGLGRVVRDNTIIWASSGGGGGTIAGVTGIILSGANGQAELAGNRFNPKINWVGGAGSQQITDNTTHTLSAGNSQFGFGTAAFDNVQIPVMNQGALSLGKGATVITGVTAGVCTLSPASSHIITFPGALAITSFTAAQLEGKLFFVRVTNANCTFTNGASLKMAGGVNFTPGANGAFVGFITHANVTWEICRTAY